MTTWEFPAPEPISLEAKVPAGSITVNAAPVTMATVSLTAPHAGKRGAELIAATTVEFDAGTLTVTVPDRLRLLSSTSLDLLVRLPHGSSCVLNAASADIRCSGQLGSLDARTASGSVTTERMTGPVSINTASGDVLLDDAAADVAVNTASGDVGIAIPAGIGVYLDLSAISGDVSSDLEPADSSSDAALSLHCRSISGDVRITRPAHAAAG